MSREVLVCRDGKKNDHDNKKRDSSPHQSKIDITSHWCRSEENFWVLVQMDGTKCSSKILPLPKQPKTPAISWLPFPLGFPDPNPRGKYSNR